MPALTIPSIRATRSFTMPATRPTHELASHELTALQHVDFDWTARLQQVWTDAAWDVAELHCREREEFAQRLQRIAADARTQSPLGWILLGGGGAGKTHLLSAFRQEAQRQDAGFVLVDMTDVRVFWDTVLQGYIDSLQMPYGHYFQYKRLLANFISRLGPTQHISKVMAQLARRKSDDLNRDIKTVIEALFRRYPKETRQYQNAVRALVCLNSDDWEISSLGLNFLQGLEIEEASRRAYGFTTARESSMQLVTALSWLMSLSGPTILAFDQLDPLVQQLGYKLLSGDDSDAAHVGRSILEEIGGGLRALLSLTRRTMMIVSCVQSSWDVLQRFTLASDRAAFEPPRLLAGIDGRTVAEAIIRERLAPAYELAEFEPPYPTWPFAPTAIAQLIHATPREVLQKCEQHRLECLRRGKPAELQSFDAAAPKRAMPAPGVRQEFEELDRRFAQARRDANPQALLEPKEEDVRLAPLLVSMLKCFLHEHHWPESVDVLLDVDFSGGKTTKPLHARLRLIYPLEDGREEHFCVRALQHTHARAYQTRLKAAMTQSGIDQQLAFRHLAIVRRGAVPGGDETRRLTGHFTQARGRFLDPSDDELRTLFALDQLRQSGHAQLNDWLKSRKPASKLSLLQACVPSAKLEPMIDTRPASPSAPPRAVTPSETNQAAERPDDVLKTPANVTPSAGSSDIDRANRTPATNAPVTATPPTAASAVEAERHEPSVAKTPPADVTPTNVTPANTNPSSTASATPATPAPAKRTTAKGLVGNDADLGLLPLGRKLAGDQTAEPLEMPVEGLEKHTVVLAGAGSGKTVLLRRLVEEAALRGIPSIVIDCANDLASLDQPWPEPPQGWFAGDERLAERYHRDTEMILWTPGRDDGNPLTLQPIPDLAALVDTPDELRIAIDMVRESLRQTVAAGNSAKSQSKLGILNASLQYFARRGFQGLDAYIGLLEDLPDEACLGVSDEQKLALEMSNHLKVQRSINPLLRTQGSSLDPLLLFGDNRSGGPTRISVINMMGLAGLELQREFLNQLAMLLFSWIKRNPNPPGRKLRGLLVIDEARDFVPSQKTTVCKESLTQLTAQARKYHLGIVFATQNAKDIDNKIVGNCSTQYYGKASSAASIDVIREQIRQRGGQGDDVPKLGRGRFYVYNADLGLRAPVKVASPMCLSHHTPNPLDETQILEKARRSRDRL